MNLSLETNEEVRVRTGDLNVGYDSDARAWEMIVKYHGDLEGAVSAISENVVVERLIAGYGILTVPANLVDAVTALPEVEYLEQPKRFFYEQLGGVLSDDCLAGVLLSPPFLTGRGVLILVADSGIDWRRKDFQTRDGRTRIRYLWDQVLNEEFDSEQINEALRNSTGAIGGLAASVDRSGHGTAVAGIAAGYSEESGYTGAAPEAELLIVKLGQSGAEGFPQTTQLMRAVTWGLSKAEELEMPLVINLSFGNCYGAHDGSSLLERFLDNAAEIGRTVICVGSGNEGDSAGHAAGQVGVSNGVGALNGVQSSNGIGALNGVQRQDGVQASNEIRTSARGSARKELAVALYERNLRVQLWQNASDEYRIYLIAPNGERAELTAPINGGKFTLRLGDTLILAYQGEPTPYAVAKELYLEFLGIDSGYIDSGIWNIVLEAVKVVTGQYYLYLSDSAVRGAGTGFVMPTPQVTLTIPSTAAKVITVGAYDPIYDAYAPFSGRGYADVNRTVGVVTAGLVKPDLVAPGVQLPAPDLFGGYMSVTGTSFATPIVSGAAALLMEWGIVRGNDPYLYGEKVKAYLRAGARPLRGENMYPNDKVGFGALCLRDSLIQFI